MKTSEFWVPVWIFFLEIHVNLKKKKNMEIQGSILPQISLAESDPGESTWLQNCERKKSQTNNI